MIVRTLVVILLIGLGPIAQAKETSFTGMELAEFLGPVPPDVVHWSRVVSIDFVVYHGVAQPPLSGRVGFYVGGWPDFKPEDGSTIVKDRLGIYPVKWYRKMRANGTIRQTGLVKLDYYWKSDVWIEAARQSDVDQLVAILAKLPTFTKKPEPIPGMPQTALEYYAREIMAIGVFLSSFSILVSIAWLLNRRWHRAGFALARRLFLLSAYVGCAMLVVAGIGIGLAWSLIAIFRWRDPAQAMFIGSAGTLLVAAVLVILFLCLGIIVRVRSRLVSA